MRDGKHIFDFFKIWARHRLLDVPRLPREKISAPSTFSAPVPIYTTKNRGAVLKILGTGAHFQRCRAQNACRVNGPLVSCISLASSLILRSSLTSRTVEFNVSLNLSFVMLLSTTSSLTLLFAFFGASPLVFSITASLPLLFPSSVTSVSARDKSARFRS